MRISARPMWRLALLAVLCHASLTPTLRGAAPPRPPSGEARLESGRVVDYTIHLDRNALRDSVRLGDSLIALTSTGILLRFELPAVRLAAEWIGALDVTCLGRGEGEVVLAGLADGRVCRVDPATLELTDVVKLPGAPQWLGWGKAGGDRPAGLVAVTRETTPMERDGRRWEQHDWVIEDRATGKTLALEFAPTAVLLDQAGRFWLGADQGEWGGRVARADLGKGTVVEFHPPRPGEIETHYWEGIYGFIELRDGQVWAFGGTSHFGDNSGHFTRIDGAEPRLLVEFEPPPDLQQKPDPSRPRWPITHVVEEDGGLLVFSYSDVFRVDRALKDWNKVATLEIRYRPGRPDAMGSYPSVRAVHPPDRAGEPYILAIAVDGYVFLQGAKATAHSLPGQLGAERIVKVLNTSEGTLFLNGDGDDVWRLGANGWEVASLAPPFEPDPANERGEYEMKEGWRTTRVLVGPQGTIYTVSGTSSSPGTRTTARRIDGKSERIGRETSSLWPSHSFITADGTLWNMDGRNLKRLEQGVWETVARVLRRGRQAELEAINTNGPPWFFHHWRLDPGAHGDDPRLTPFEIREREKTLLFADAIPWTDGALLLATNAGLRAFDPGAQTLSRVNLPEPEQPAVVLARDGRGRLWLGGHFGRLGPGLGLSEPGAKTSEALDRVPWVGRLPVHDLAPDPQHPVGVIAALGARGVAFIRAGQRP